MHQTHDLRYNVFLILLMWSSNYSMLLFRGNVSQIRGGSLGAVILLHQVL